MPFKSKAQQRFMFANKDKLEAEGVDVDEWADKTDYEGLPEKADDADKDAKKESSERQGIKMTLSSKVFQTVYLPKFTEKLASFGITIRDDNDLGHLLKIAGQLKALGVPSSLDQVSTTYKVASAKLASLMQEMAASELKKANSKK